MSPSESYIGKATRMLDSGESDDTEIEKKLRDSSTLKDSGIMRSLASLWGWRQPPVQFVDPRRNTVWLLDNTAYQPISPDTLRRQRSWYAEVTACIFERKEGSDVGKYVSTIADLIGLDGEVGADGEARRRIRHRLQPFLDNISPRRLITLEIPVPNYSTQAHTIGPSNDSGISNQVVCIGTHYIEDGTKVQSYLQGNKKVSMNTIFSAPEGWIVISDIDDTIKHTKTSDQTGILQTTFAEEPRPISGMPELYSYIQKELFPTWFYVSASPYNLYPFLHEFIHTHYSHGTIFLRYFSWRDLGSLLRSFTKHTQEYKVDRIEMIHHWFPRRRVVCVGDSTQKDPEAYAEIYKKHPEWVQAILIRKVTDIPNMEERNSPKRFEESFKDIPDNVWKVFEQPDEVYELVDELGTKDTAYL
ncbi:hypothetical protein PHISCL_03095 [Aspergillus sclerotialis]|uniref:Phosphatidate phosphatase APP1 catalytic domain-containing protein n=1 Tax=Aspergillus sclerotialis TaxID=2070753 RepID=A0A3A2ZYW6_9EURO|nr:hypothetical protein PHISCL_03095 [Aspergillus sclerotialis]